LIWNLPVAPDFTGRSGIYWFIFQQDAAGSIWKVDLSFSLSMQKPTRIYRCHAQEVTTLTG
jgi:hypothetical protein